MSGLAGSRLERWRARILGLSKSRVIRNALVLYGVQLSTYLFPLITLPLLSRVLRPEKFGLLAYAQGFIFYFVTLTEFGFNLTATRRIAVHAEDRREVERYFHAVMGAKTLLLVGSFVLMEATVWAIPKLRAEWPLYSISFLTVVGWFLFPVWLFQGLQKMHHIGLRDFLSKLLATVVLFALVRREDDYLLAAAIQSGAPVLSGAIGLWVARRALGVRLFALPAWQDVREMMREAWPVFVSMAALTLTNSTNIFVLGLRSTAQDVGYYMSAFRVVVAVRMLVSPVATALYPHISRKAADSPSAALVFLRRYALLTALPFLLASLGLLAGAGFIVDLVFGPLYGPSKRLMMIMAPSPFLLALGHVYSTYYMLAFGYEKQWSRIIVRCTVLNFALLLPLIYLVTPSVGVALTGTVVDMAGLSMAYWFYHQQMKKGRLGVGSENFGG